MSAKWLLFAWLSFATTCTAVLSEPERWFRRNVFLDQERRFHMEWETGDSQEIVFKLEVRTLGYVALGFSKDGTMVDSDVVVGWVSDDGEVHLQDRHGEGDRMPELDKHPDYELISGSENATHTTLVFKRQWDTCDCQDFAFEYDNTIRVMHAYAYEDPHEEINIPLLSSNKRGWRSIMLLQADIPREEGLQFDVLTNNFTVSSDWDTLYWCKLMKTPDLPKKHHVTMWEPLFLEGNKARFVHHMIVLECIDPNPHEYDQYLDDDGYDCNDPMSPSFTRECGAYFAGWGIGGEGTILPEHIGFPMKSNTYIVLQVHYDNTNREMGVPGRTGLHFEYTPHLRQYDGALLPIGAEIAFDVMAPPGVRDYVVAGHHNPDCTSPIMPPEGIMLHSTFFHTHLIGRSVKHRHFRNNVELRPLANNKHYDSSYQQMNVFDEERLMLPQDQLTVECTYDSTGRSKTTIGGFGTREEMCSSFLIYYPKFEGVYGSRSIPSKRKTTQLLGSKRIMSLTDNTPDYDQHFFDIMTDYNWNRTAVRWFERKQRYSKHDTFCNIGTEVRNTVETKISYPENLLEYVEPPSSCVGRQQQKKENGRRLEEHRGEEQKQHKVYRQDL